ncbi:MAG: hypothetical protein ABUL64_02085, partial [Singulisphaera sp.]
MHATLLVHSLRRDLSTLAIVACVALATHAQAADQAGKTIPGIGPTGPATEIAGTFKFTEGPATAKDGTVYFTDVPVQKIYKIEPDNTVSIVR